MFKDILKITPKIDGKDLNNMERQLNSRFTKIAKGFGKGVANAFKGGGIAGIALGLIDKLLNPLQEVKESIDKILNKTDDVSTYAKQFETTSGKLAKLLALGKAAGLDPQALYVLLNKFQSAVVGYRANPLDPANSSVANFAGEKDTAEAFFKFIQALQKLPKDLQVQVQSQVFGEKQILKMSDFLGSNFAEAFKAVGADKIDTAQLTKDIDSNATLNDLQDTLASRRELKDYGPKARLITEDLIRAKQASEDLALRKENQQIANYENLAAISQTVDKIMLVVNEGLFALGGLIKKLEPMIKSLMDTLDAFRKTPLMKSVGGWFGGRKKGD